jgi:hypothetical protein
MQDLLLQDLLWHQLGPTIDDNMELLIFFANIVLDCFDSLPQNLLTTSSAVTLGEINYRAELTSWDGKSRWF